MGREDGGYQLQQAERVEFHASAVARNAFSTESKGICSAGGSRTYSSILLPNRQDAGADFQSSRVGLKTDDFLVTKTKWWVDLFIRRQGCLRIIRLSQPKPKAYEAERLQECEQQKHGGVIATCAEIPNHRVEEYSPNSPG